jgi:hypothetical protein
MGKTQSKPLVEPHGSGTAWERHGMCELALKDQCIYSVHTGCGVHREVPSALSLWVSSSDHFPKLIAEVTHLCGCLLRMCQ